MAEKKNKKKQLPLKDQTIQTLESEGLEAAVRLLRQADLPPAEHIPLYTELMRYAYWQQKDLPAAIEISQTGIRHGRALAECRPEDAETILAQVKAIHYDLASFTWPGWDEEGIEIAKEQVRLGLDSARTNLEMAVRLKKDALPLSRAYWMLGAQQIAAGDKTQALASFTMAEQRAAEAGVHSEELLAQGFACLTGLLDDPEDQSLQIEMAEIKTALLDEEHGEMFVQQIEDAQRVFSSFQ